MVPGSGCRDGGPLDRAAAEDREVEDVGVAVGARLGGIVKGLVCWIRWRARLGWGYGMLNGRLLVR